MSKTYEAATHSRQVNPCLSDYSVTGSNPLTAAERQILILTAGKKTNKEESIISQAYTKESGSKSRTIFATHSTVKVKLAKLGLVIALLVIQATMSNTRRLLRTAVKSTLVLATTA